MMTRRRATNHDIVPCCVKLMSSETTEKTAEAGPSTWPLSCRLGDAPAFSSSLDIFPAGSPCACRLGRIRLRGCGLKWSKSSLRHPTHCVGGSVGAFKLVMNRDVDIMISCWSQVRNCLTADRVWMTVPKWFGLMLLPSSRAFE